MAATSSGSAEFIAMSSLFTYDVYKVQSHAIKRRNINMNGL